MYYLLRVNTSDPIETVIVYRGKENDFQTLKQVNLKWFVCFSNVITLPRGQLLYLLFYSEWDNIFSEVSQLGM